MMMHLSILANGAQQTLPAHRQIIVPAAHILFQCRVDQQTCIVCISNASIGRMPLDVTSHLLQRSGKCALPLIPWPYRTCGQTVGATLQRVGEHAGTEGHMVAQGYRHRWSNAELNGSAVLIDKATPLSMLPKLGEIVRCFSKANHNGQGKDQTPSGRSTHDSHGASLEQLWVYFPHRTHLLWVPHTALLLDRILNEPSMMTSGNFEAQTFDHPISIVIVADPKISFCLGVGDSNGRGLSVFYLRT